MSDRFRLALGDVLADRNRTLLTIAALAPLIIAFFIVAALADGIRDVTGSGGPDLNLVVAERDLLDLAVGQIDAADLAALAEAAGEDVTRVSPMIFRVLLVDDATLPKNSSGLEAKVLQVRGAHIDTWEPQHGLRLERGSYPERANEAVITEPVVALTGWDVGSRIAVFGSEFRVSGVVSAAGTKAVSIWIDYPRAEALFDDPGAQLAYLQLADGADAEAVRQRLAGDPAFSDYAVVLESRLARLEREAVRAWGPVFVVPVAMALALIGFGTFNFATMSIEERRREIGVLRSLGYGPRAIRGIATARALLIAVVSFVLAWLLAWTFMGRSRTVDVLGEAVTVGLTPRITLLGVVLTIAVTWVGVRIAGHRLETARVGELLER